MIITGKRVAIVGPAAHIVDIDQKDYIKSFDIVVRINNSLPIPEDVRKATSNRCDLLYIYGRAKPVKEWNDVKEIKISSYYLWGVHPKYNSRKASWRKTKHYAFKEKITTCHPDVYYPFIKKTQSVPNRGLAAMIDILMQEPEELYITGFTFFKLSGKKGGLYYENRIEMPERKRERLIKRGGNSGAHKIKPQIEYFIKYIYSNSKVKVDFVLGKIVQEEKKKPFKWFK